MLKIIFFLLFFLSVCFLSNMYWMVQVLMFFMSFMFLLVNNLLNYWTEISYFLGCDILSNGMILLSLRIFSLMLLASESINKLNNYKNSFLLNIVMLLLLLLVLTFSSMNLFMYYLFFESIPTLFLILGWGYQPERLQAGIYLLFYTLLFSLPM